MDKSKTKSTKSTPKVINNILNDIVVGSKNTTINANANANTNINTNTNTNAYANANITITDNDLFPKSKSKSKSNKKKPTDISSLFEEAIETVPKSKLIENKVKVDKSSKALKVTKIDEDEEDDGEDTNVYKKNGYVRPDITYTDQLSKDQIEQKLEDYKKVDDIFQVPLGVHMRYFSNVDGKMVFRMGGQLHKNTGLPAYVILSNGKNQWSVQVKDTIFYRKMVLQEIKEEYEKIINDLIVKNKKLKEKIAKLEK